MIWWWHIHKVVLHLPDSRSNCNLQMLVFEERGKPETSRSKIGEATTNPTHIASTPGFELGRHWWETSALITAASLLPQQTIATMRRLRAKKRRESD